MLLVHMLEVASIYVLFNFSCKMTGDRFIQFLILLVDHAKDPQPFTVGKHMLVANNTPFASSPDQRLINIAILLICITLGGSQLLATDKDVLAEFRDKISDSDFSAAYQILKRNPLTQLGNVLPAFNAYNASDNLHRSRLNPPQPLSHSPS